MEYAATNYDAAFVLKTDDDAFINVVPLLAQLAAMCENPGCRRERVYMGKMAKHSEVLLQPGHKWNNAAFHNHTGAGARGSRRRAPLPGRFFIEAARPLARALSPAVTASLLRPRPCLLLPPQASRSTPTT